MQSCGITRGRFVNIAHPCRPRVVRFPNTQNRIGGTPGGKLQRVEMCLVRDGVWGPGDFTCRNNGEGTFEILEDPWSIPGEKIHKESVGEEEDESLNDSARGVSGQMCSSNQSVLLAHIVELYTNTALGDVERGGWVVLISCSNSCAATL